MRGTPWDQSWTVSDSGKRVWERRVLRSSSTVWGIWIVKGVIIVEFGFSIENRILFLSRDVNVHAAGELLFVFRQVGTEGVEVWKIPYMICNQEIFGSNIA